MTSLSYLSRIYQHADHTTEIGREVKRVADRFVGELEARFRAMFINEHTGRTATVVDDVDYTRHLLYPLAKVPSEAFEEYTGGVLAGRVTRLPSRHETGYQIRIQPDESRRVMVDQYNQFLAPGESPDVYRPLMLEDVISRHPDSTDDATHKILLPMVNHRVQGRDLIPSLEELRDNPLVYRNLNELPFLTWRRDMISNGPAQGHLSLPKTAPQGRRRSFDVSLGTPQPPKAEADFHTQADKLASQRELSRHKFSLPEKLASPREITVRGNSSTPTTPHVPLEKVIERLGHYQRRLSEK